MPRKKKPSKRQQQEEDIAHVLDVLGQRVTGSQARSALVKHKWSLSETIEALLLSLPEGQEVMVATQAPGDALMTSHGPASSRSASKSKSRQKCFGCGEVGHRKQDCPKRKARREQNMKCYVCGGPHRRADCPGIGSQAFFFFFLFFLFKICYNVLPLPGVWAVLAGTTSLLVSLLFPLFSFMSDLLFGGNDFFAIGKYMYLFIYVYLCHKDYLICLFCHFYV